MTATRRYARSSEEVLAPGAILQAVLDAQGRSQADLARSTGMTTKHINQIVTGVASVTITTAKTLQVETGIPARLWLALEASHRLSKSEAQ